MQSLSTFDLKSAKPNQIVQAFATQLLSGKCSFKLSINSSRIATIRYNFKILQTSNITTYETVQRCQAQAQLEAK